MLADSSNGDQCERCITYRRTLAKAASRKTETEAPAHSHRYLSSPQKVARIKELQHKKSVAKKDRPVVEENRRANTKNWGVLGRRLGMVT